MLALGDSVRGGTTAGGSVSTSTEEVWTLIRALRCQVADRLEALEEPHWDSPSWCQNWRVRDVLAHLVHFAEATQLSMLRDILFHGGRPNRAISVVALQIGDRPVPELAARLRTAANGRFRVLGMPPPAVLGELVVHGNDALRPLGQELTVTPEALIPALDLYIRIGRFAFHSAPRGGIRLQATDVLWSHGTGAEIKGRAVDLLLFLGNRTDVRQLLRGPGLSR